MKAKLSTYRQSPRKVRQVVNLVRGKKASVALAELSFLPKRAALPIQKLVASAIANALKNSGQNTESLVIKSISVTKGPTLKRSMPRSRGMANRINKRTSIVTVELGEKAAKASK